MTVQTLRNAGASTIVVNTTSGAPTGGFFASMGTPHTFTDPQTGETVTIISDATAVDFAGHITAGNVVIDAIAPGQTDLGSKVGDVIVIRPLTEWSNNLYNILAQEHADDGKHNNITYNGLLQNTTQIDPTNQYLYSNAIINGGCQVAQRLAPTISTSYQYGAVDRFAAKATGTAVSAGTVTQLTSSLLAAIRGYDLQIAGLTVTGTGIAYLRYRMESKEAMNFINAVASFGCRVYHNVGSAVNYTIYIRKANAADNFSAVTDIANSGAISVPNATATWIKFENINSGSLGDVTNGIEIEIQIACGAVTTKNFNFAEFVFNKGAKAAQFIPRNFDEEMKRCTRYCQKFKPSTTDNFTRFGLGQATAATTVATIVPLIGEMRAIPTLVTPAATNLGHTVASGSVNGCSSVSLSGNGRSTQMVAIDTVTTGMVAGNASALLANGNQVAYMQFEAEL